MIDIKTINEERKSIGNKHLFALSVSHFNSINEIDKRCICITITLIGISDIKRIAGLISLKINKAICGKSYPDIRDRPGIILSLDVEGTRTHSAELHKAICPHFHGIIFLPESKDNSYEINKIKTEISMHIMKIKELTENDNSIWIKEFDQTNKSMFYMIGYNNKLDLLHSVAAYRDSNTYIYPFDQLERYVGNKSKEEIINNAEAILFDVIWDHRSFFTDKNQQKLCRSQDKTLNAYRKIQCGVRKEKFRRNYIRNVCGNQLARYRAEGFIIQSASRPGVSGC